MAITEYRVKAVDNGENGWSPWIPTEIEQSADPKVMASRINLANLTHVVMAKGGELAGKARIKNDGGTNLLIEWRTRQTAYLCCIGEEKILINATDKAEASVKLEAMLRSDEERLNRLLPKFLSGDFSVDGEYELIDSYEDPN